MLLFMSCLLLTLLPQEGWVREIEKRVEPSAVDWLREQLNQALPEKPLDLLGTPCFSSSPSPEKFLYVFASFSMPDSMWVSLSRELELKGGILVLRGLPNNSFQEFAKKLMQLRERGVTCTVQIHPELFREYNVTCVPTFVLVEGSDRHRVCGALSLDYALSLFEEERR